MANLHTIRSTLGVPRHVLAHFLCTHEQSLFRWEKSPENVPAGVALFLEALNLAMWKSGAPEVAAILTNNTLSKLEMLHRVLELALREER